MRFSLFVATSIVFTLAVGGCANISNIWKQPAPVSQKQSSNYKPYYQGDYKPNTTVVGQPGAYAGAPAPQAQPQPQGKVKAAILLPLSGKNAGLGQAMLNASQQAVFDAAEDDFEIEPRDTAADGGAEAAAKAAVADGAKLIIGPLFASDVPSVKLVAQTNGLMMLPLSTDTSLADKGVFVMGLAPGAQVERVVSYAVAHGAHSFAALAPSTPYGNLVADVFRKAVAQSGQRLVDVQIYDPAAHDLNQKIAALAIERNEIDALFLPESDKNLKSITDQLTASGFISTHVHMLGTGLWDVPDLGRQNPLLIGGWYAAPDPSMRRNFIANYTATYNEDPPRLATLAYDATALAAVLAKKGGRYDQAALTNPNGFAGLDGIFRLTVTGGVERGMAVNEVTPDGVKVVDPAPTSFVTAKK